MAPSIHPDGSAYTWEAEGKAAEIDFSVLVAAVGKGAASGLLTRYWPGQGQRNDVSLALAGMLIHGGWEVEEAERFIFVTACAAGDEEAESRAKNALSTARAADDGRPTTGAPTLAKFFDPKVVRAVRDWLGLGASPGGGPWPEFPEVNIGGRLRDAAAETIRAIQASNNPPVLYRRGTEVVRFCDAGSSRVQAMTVAALKGHIDRVADFVKVTSSGIVPARPPSDLAPDLLSLPPAGFPLPHLQGVRMAPCFAAGGRLLAEPGYDPDTGLYLDWSAPLPALPEPEEALALIKEALQDFPFADEGSRAHTVAALLLAFCRDLIDGPTPLHLIDAPARGTGKGLLADVIGIVQTGHHAPTMSLPGEEAEIEKRITSQLLEAFPVVLMDNVTRLKSDALCAVLTSVRWTGRRLGKSEMVTVPNDAVWLATGNNPQISDEMVRRIAPIRLDAGMERPEERTTFAIKDLPAWVKARRHEFVGACLALIKAWFDAGQPAGERTIGRFEAWSRTMGGILEVNGVGGFLANRERLHIEADPETAEWGEACRAWADEFGFIPVTAKSLHELFRHHELLSDLWAERSVLAGQQRLGRALLQRRDRVFSRYRIRYAGRDPNTGNHSYKLETVASAAVGSQTPGTPGTTGPMPEPVDASQPAHADPAGRLPTVEGVSTGVPGRQETPKRRGRQSARRANPGSKGGVSGVPDGDLF